jgi:transcriptional regulator with XRE-family HTH domain
MNSQIHTGQRIKKFRKANGMTQKDLGLKVGVTFQQIQKYEKGVNSAPIERLKQMAQILDVTIYDLLTPSDNPSNNNNYYVEKIMYLMNKLETEEEKKKIVDIISVMVG